MTALPTKFPDFGLTPEQRRLAVRSHYYETPGMDGDRGEIWCYSDRFSYRPDERVRLQVSATAPRFDIEIVRDGAAQTKVLEHRRSEEHTSELQSRENLVCRLLLEKKKK